MGGIQDTELEKCQSIQEIIELITFRKQGFADEKANIEIHFKEKTSEPNENVKVSGGKNELEKISEDSGEIANLYQKSIDYLEKFKDKLPVEKTIKFIKKISHFANEREPSNMKNEVNNFIFYCKDNFLFND